MPEREDDEAPPAPRAFWSGTVTFGLVSVPVDFMPATRAGGLPLRMLDEDGTPLARRYWCPKHEEFVEDEDIVRGYEVDDGTFVIVEDEELERLEPEKTREIDLQRFVDLEELDPVFFERAYFLAPAGDSTKAYRLLVAAMEEAGKAGIATFVMRTREYVVALIAEDGILRAETMRFADEVRTPADVGLQETKPKKADVATMSRAIARLTKKTIDRKALEDERVKALETLVAKKLRKGDDVVELPEGEGAVLEDDSVIDLMKILKERMRGDAEAEPEAPPKRKPAAKKSKKKAKAKAKAKKRPRTGRRSA